MPKKTRLIDMFRDHWSSSFLLWFFLVLGFGTLEQDLQLTSGAGFFGVTSTIVGKYSICFIAAGVLSVIDRVIERRRVCAANNNTRDPDAKA